MKRVHRADKPGQLPRRQAAIGQAAIGCRDRSGRDRLSRSAMPRSTGSRSVMPRSVVAIGHAAIDRTVIAQSTTAPHLHAAPGRLHEFSVQEPKRGQWTPGARQFGPLDRPDRITGSGLARRSQEILVRPDLLLTPCLVGQRGEVIGKNLRHPRGAAHGSNDRPKRIIARRVQADRFNHPAKLTRLIVKIKAPPRQKNATQKKRRYGRGTGRTAHKVVTPMSVTSGRKQDTGKTGSMARNVSASP